MIKVLIADDQELIRQSLSIVLNTKEGIEVTDTVANGQEVIASVRKNRPDVILMDSSPISVTVDSFVTAICVSLCGHSYVE